MFDDYLIANSFMFLFFLFFSFLTTQYKNINGNGTFSSEMVVTTNVQGPWMVAVGDLDNDGHPDVASASQTDNTIAWVRTLV